MLAYYLHIGILINAAYSHVLNSLLQTYHTLHKDDVIIKHYPKTENLVITLNIGDVTHVATLVPYQEIFHKHFKTVVIDGNSSIHLNNPIQGHFVGKLDRFNESRVVIHVDDDNYITGNLEVSGELFYIEPSWRHISELHEFHMIVYKKSDVLSDLGQMGQICESSEDLFPSSSFVDPQEDAHYNDVETEKTDFSNDVDIESGYHRFKRSSSRPKDTCEVILIADYKFYSEIGGGNEFKTKTFLIAIFERINRIFKNTVFEASDRQFSGFGMQIKTMLIHKTPSSDPDNYNFEPLTGWDVTEMLNAFGYGTELLGETWSDYCLAHLYTNYDFPLGVLGLAYVASPISNKIGGICSPPYHSKKADKMRMLNVGLTTSRNYGRTLLSSELELVSAHEIGHNWGSSHDPDTTDTCAPPDNRYIMYPSAVDGSSSNNQKFSPCSNAAIASVLKYKSSCFVESTLSFCGNGIVEDNEECDAGPDRKTDACCTDTCTFRDGAVCSDHNSDCCVGCLFAGTQHVCYQADTDNTRDIINGCVAEKRCSAGEARCGIIQHKPAGSPCFDEGMCDGGGNCLDFCQAKGLTLCQGKGNNSCHWMCSDGSTDDPCSIRFHQLPDGKLCPNGVCVGGECVVEPQTQVKIWEVLTGLTPSLFWKWMKNNVLLVVIVITSLFWIPLSVFINWLDQGQDELEYYTETLQQNRNIIRTQMSTQMSTQISSVSSKSFEMKPIRVYRQEREREKREEGENIFSLTGEKF